MKISEVEKIALEHMARHGMKAPYWKLVFVKHKSFAGRCYKYNWNGTKNLRGRIELSIPYMESLPDEEVIDTIDHEIAHGMTDPKYKPHGPEWKANARLTGAKPKATFFIGTAVLGARYLGTCPNGHQSEMHKKTARVTGNFSYCIPCTKKLPKDEYAWVTWVDTKTGQVMNPGKPVVQLVAAAKKPVTAKATGKVSYGLDTSTPRKLSWKEKYDAGMTSFDNDW